MATDFAVFEVVVKAGLELQFRLEDLVVASSSVIAGDGQTIYFCATVQPVALRTHLSTSAEVLSFSEFGDGPS
jgi:hypothetical protein